MKNLNETEKELKWVTEDKQKFDQKLIEYTSEIVKLTELNKVFRCENKNLKDQMIIINS